MKSAKVSPEERLNSMAKSEIPVELLVVIRCLVPIASFELSKVTTGAALELICYYKLVPDPEPLCYYLVGY